MATTRKLPDLVNDSKLLVELHETHAHYFNICNDNVRRRTWKKETWTRTKRLGGGATGEVWLEECHTGEKMGQVQAVKVISKVSHFDVYQELETIAKFSQSTSKYEGLFVKSLGWYENDKSVFLVMEHIEHGSLASHLTHPLSEDEARQITVQILEGLACFHENEFVHRDLKPDNILVASRGPEWWVKIGDFGFSKRTSGDNSLHSFVGTQKYFAPEVLGLLPHWVAPDTEAGGRYRCTYPMDMWSLGVTVFYMLCHDYPFEGDELLDYLRGSPFPVARLSRQRISQAGCTFIEALLTVDPAKRLSAAAALKHSWLEGYRDEIPSAMSENLPPVVRNEPMAQPSVTEASASWPMSSTWASQSGRRELTLKSTGAISEPERITLPELHISDPQMDVQDELTDFYEIGLRLITEKEYTQAEALFQQVVEGRRINLGPSDKSTLASMQQLGVTYFFQGRYEDAQKTLQVSADLRTEALGSTHIDTLSSHYWLSNSLFQQGKFDAAEEIIERAAEIQKVTLGLENEDTIKSLYLDGRIQYQQERYGKALTLFEQATDAALGVNQELASEMLQTLAKCLHKLKRYKDTQTVLEQVLQISPLAPDLAQSVDLLFDVGQSLYRAKRYTDAQSAFEKVSEHRKESLGASHKQTVDSTLLLASSLRMQQGKVTQARDTLRQLLVMASPTTRTSVLGQLHEIGETLWYAEAYEDAYFTFQEVLEKRRVLLGKKHRDTLRSAAWLGRSLLHQGQYDDATELLQSVEKGLRGLSIIYQYEHLDSTNTRLWLGLSLHYQGQSKLGHSYIAPLHQMFKRKLGESHKDTAMCLRYTGSSYGKVKDYSAAQHTLSSALSIAKTVFGLKHEETIRAQINLGITLYWRKSYTRSLEHFHPAANAQTAVLGKSHADTLETLFYIGATLDALKRYKESERYWRKVVDGRKKHFGATHPETQTAMRSLGLCLAHQNKWGSAADIQEQVLEARKETLEPSDAATLQSKHDVEKCKKALSGKWVILWPERIQLDYRRL